MNTRELRIGNFVEVNGRIAEVGAINTEKKVVLKVKIEGEPVAEVPATEIDPILLSHHLLKKCCSFDERGLHIIGVDEHRYSLKITDTYVTLLNSEEEEMIHFWDVRSLHQLQNLYYALKGAEMKVNL